MEGLPEGIDSRFRYVLLVSKRAEQLIQGAQARTKSKHAKPTRVAMEEVRTGLIDYALPPGLESAAVRAEYQDRQQG